MRKENVRVEERTNDLKNDILWVAQEMFRELGYDGTTFQKIADRLGITKGSITYHFKNKHFIIGDLIQHYFETVRQYIELYPEHYENEYWKYSVMYIFAYRTILSDERNMALFYHKNQMVLWENVKVDTIKDIYKKIAKDFHKGMSEEELAMTAVMDLGARRRLYLEYTHENEILTIDKFAYYHIYLMGMLSKLDEATIKSNIDKAFAFANQHVPPVTPLFSKQKKEGTL